MERQAGAAPAGRYGSWTAVSQAPDHPLAALEDQALAGSRLRVLLGPTSRFGARYFAVLLATADGGLSRAPVLSGLHHSGPLRTYNWIEVAETNEQVTLSDESHIDIGLEGQERLFRLLLAVLPLGGHLMVEYDSPQRAETARGLAQGVPGLATPLGGLLFRIGCGAHLKDWQIAEGGREGPRKLQAYKPPSPHDARRWRREAAHQLEAFLEGPPSSSDIVRAARERAAALLPLLTEGPRHMPQT